MSSERGAANIRKFNAEREAKNTALVEYELRLCQKRRLKFSSISQLAAHLSDRTNVHRTSLIRNPKYKALIALYVKLQPGAATVVADQTDDVDVLRAKFFSAQAEIGILRHEIKRLAAQRRHVDNGAKSLEHGSTTDVANLCMLLALVLIRTRTFAVEVQKRSIIDLAARPSDAVVAGPERTAAFISWMGQNSELPAVIELRRLRS